MNMKLYFSKDEVYDRAYFSLRILSSNTDTFEALRIFGDPIGLNVSAKPVENLQCILIDEDFFNKFDFEKEKDDNGNNITIELYSKEEKLLVKQESYLIYYQHPSSYADDNFVIKQGRGIPFKDLFKQFDVELLFGKGMEEKNLKNR